MTAQGIETVSLPSMNLNYSNQSSSSISNISDSLIMNERVNVAITLTLLVGFIQVRFKRSQKK
jgi:hypothetical protein